MSRISLFRMPALLHCAEEARLSIWNASFDAIGYNRVRKSDTEQCL